MIRFSAGVEEISSLLHFLQKRSRHEELLLVPLASPEQKVSRVPFRLRRTPRPLIRLLTASEESVRWGILTHLDPVPKSRAEAEASCLFLILIGPRDGNDRRNALLEVRDELSEEREPTPRTHLARQLGEKCIRRVRRRGELRQGRWHLPD